MKRMNCYFLLLAASLCVLPLHAQKEYPIDRITAINLGDGRILHREISGDKPLDGEHRIIDGYHSAYILARFKDGLYNGDYEEYIYNKLKAKGSYKEGWKDGTFRKYDDEGRVTEEKSYKSGKLDGAHRTFYTNGKLEMERFYKGGKQDGKDMYYEFDGTLRREHNYKDGKQTGKQYSYIKGTFELKETSYYNEQGLLDGDFEQLYLFGQPRTTGHYKNGQKDGTWVQIAETPCTSQPIVKGMKKGFRSVLTERPVHGSRNITKRTTGMTVFTGSTTRQPENLSMRQPTSLDGSTARRSHWCATTGSTIGKPAPTSTDDKPVPSSRAT